jgi:hypothetical protein
MDARAIMKAAEDKADEISREALPVVSMTDCRRCKGTGIYYLASGAPAECAGAWCTGGKAPATNEGKAIWKAACASKELRRLRILWAGARDALRANPTKSAKWEIEHLMASVEAKGKALKAEV